jgi:glucose-6-phosphate 1-dehydrogenase
MLDTLEPLAARVAELHSHSNPLKSGSTEAPTPQPCVLVIFGAAGDLAWRKLLPAVYNLHVDGVLPAQFAVVGFGLGAEGDGDTWLRNRARDGVRRFSRRQLDSGSWEDFARSLFYVSGSFNDLAAYARLKTRLEGVDHQFGILGSRVYYLSVPPQMAPVCVEHLKTVGLVSDPAQTRSFTRVIVEKPIGRDLQSAREINASLAQAFDESQTYRIDHYLGKETVQNLLVLRFANSIFEPLWNHRHVDHVQITVAEEDGVGSRIGYYEGIGALRDMVQNHLLQVLCLAAMEPPWSLAPDVVRDAKIGVLHCLRPLAGEEVDRAVVRGQYIAGEANGNAVPDYQFEVNEFLARQGKPPSESQTETFVALRLFVDNWRWAGVPFYLRTGKRLPKRASEVAIQFKQVPQVLFNSRRDRPLEPTVLSIQIQPEEGLSLRIASKLPGPKVRIYPVKMEFNYHSSFGGLSPEAYERLILDVMAGDATLFMRRDAVEAAWQWIMPILTHWERGGVRYLPQYRAGTWGPLEADRLIEADGRQWRML